MASSAFLPTGNHDQTLKRINWLISEVNDNSSLKLSPRTNVKSNAEALEKLAELLHRYGYSTLIQHYLRLVGRFSLEERAVINQWTDFATNCVDRCTSSKTDINCVLKNLNSYLSTRPFIAGTELTLSDLIVFLSVHPIVSQVSFQEKETIHHVSRWFRNVQRVVTTPKWSTPVIFSRNALYSS